MANNRSRTPLLPTFHKRLFGRPPVKSVSRLIHEQFDELGYFALERLKDLFGACLPANVLRIDKQAGGKGANSREAILTPAVTFWGFLSQVLSPGSSCREALAKIQVLCASQKQKAPSSDTSVYCKARRRLEMKDLQSIQQHSAQRLEANTPSGDLWKERRTLLADATTVSMPDTPENQECWPQSSNQAEGCGFPSMTMVGLFSLASSALMGVAKSTLNANESGLLYKLKELFRSGDVLVGDRIYCSYVNINWLLALGVDVVFRKNQSRNSEKCRTKTLGHNDRLVYWKKPLSRPAHAGLTRQLWETLVQTICVREISFRVEQKGFRSRELTIITTLLDPVQYPAEELAELYLKRWRIELWFDDIKTSMQMDVLRCRKPKMIEKELVMHLIAYNMVRLVMQAAALNHGQAPESMSFKGTVDRIKQWAWSIIFAHSANQRQQMYDKLLESIAEDPVVTRPHRYEPRVVKRRAKAYDSMKKPRQQYRDEFYAASAAVPNS